MNKKKLVVLVLVLSLSLLLTACGGNEKASVDAEGAVKLHIIATNWQLESNVKEIPLGSTVNVTMESKLGRHNILIEGYDIEVNPGETITFTADKPGEFIIRCNLLCGPVESHENQTIKIVVK